MFGGQTIVEVCSQHLYERPQPLSTHGVDVPSELEAIVLACLEKDPARRPQSAAALRQQLQACHIQPWTAEDARLWWLEHQAQLEPTPAPNTSGPKTIAVQGLRGNAS